MEDADRSRRMPFPEILMIECMNSIGSTLSQSMSILKGSVL